MIDVMGTFSTHQNFVKNQFRTIKQRFSNMVIQLCFVEGQVKKHPYNPRKVQRLSNIDYQFLLLCLHYHISFILEER